MNIFFGLCGEGSRFRDKGYTLPKYLIPYNGSTMLYHAVETLKIPGKIHFVVKEEHLKEYSFLEKMLLALGDEIIVCYNKTEGAAQSLLLAKHHITNTNDPFISVNCDQYLDWSSAKFIDTLSKDTETSYILTYKETSPKCSYIKKDKTGFVTEVREKKVISNDATIGVYHWAHTKDFFIDAESMIDSGIKENNEYYVAPVYNWSIQRGLKVKNFELSSKEFWPVGTVDDLNHFLGNNHNFL
jgi:NDP-sugar pyrophosphorylase family protein